MLDKIDMVPVSLALVIQQETDQKIKEVIAVLKTIKDSSRLPCGCKLRDSA